MNAKTTIRKILFVTVWLCIGAGMLTLLLAAISKKNKDRCQDYHITLKGALHNFFIDEKQVNELLLKAARGDIKGQPVSSFNLHELEKALKQNAWIQDAEIYFDNHDVLHVTVTEREPVARIFTIAGNSFYLDSQGEEMPLSDKVSARLPVFTGFPDKKTLSAKDSLLLNDVRMTANYIVNDPFWKSQVAQIDITPERKFEMIPVVGNHIVKLGEGEDIAAKFNRLMIFYKQVLAKTGFDAYKLIDVQYRGQVVASKYAGNPKIDSIQLRKNVEKLLQESIDAANDTITRQVPEVMKPVADTTTVSTQDVPVSSANHPRIKENKPRATKKKTRMPVQQERKPKAVMPKRLVAEDSNGYN